MIPQFGWRSVLVLGGTAPLVLLVLMVFAMPESVRYMVAKGYAAERIRETKYPQAEDFVARNILLRPSEEEMLKVFTRAELKG